MTTNKTAGVNTPTPKTKQSAKKPVGITFLNDLVKETKARSRYYLNESKENVIEYNKIFAKETQDKLIAEITEAQLHCEINKINYLQSDIEHLQYAHFLMIKHFSSFDKMLNGKDFDYHIQIMNNMYNTGIYDLFFSEIFDKKEVQSVIKKIYQIRDTMVKLEEQLEIEKLKLKANVKNEEVLNAGTEKLDKILN